jgi:type VI secretion system protein VasJ
MNVLAHSDLGKTPVSEALPAGADLTAEPLYEQLSVEIKKLSSPTAEGSIDWRTIQNLATEILGTKSKHILVACGLSLAWYHTAGWYGFAEGVRVVKDLLLTYWEQCFPDKKRMRGRRNALVWWKEQIDRLIETSEGEQWDSDARLALLDALEEIDRFLGEQMEDAPLFRSTIQAISTLITEAPAAEPESPPPSAVKDPASPSQVDRETGTAAPPLGTRQKKESATMAENVSPEKNFARGSESLRLAATQLLQNDPFHPLAFRINRIVAWFPIETLPPASGGTTLLPPPDDQLVSSLRNLAESGNWQGLLQAAEAQMRLHLLWFDLSRYVAEALDRLGKTLASEGVAYETWLLTRRIPGIEKLTFSDGTPFADQATRDWLKELHSGQERGGKTAANAIQGDQELTEKLAEAQGLARDNKFAEALQILRQGLKTAGGGRERLLWTMGLCRLLCRQQHAALAFPFSETLLAQLDHYCLEQWEPELAEEALEVAYQVLRLQGKDEDGGQRMHAVLNRLALLNPARALDIR